MAWWHDIGRIDPRKRLDVSLSVDRVQRAFVSARIAVNIPLDVLLVEDNPGDVRLTRETFRDANKSVRLHVAADGVEIGRV